MAERAHFDGYAYETRRIAVPGGEVTAYSIGDGPEALLLVSGGPGLSCDYVRDSHARLAGSRYRVVSWDQLGTGASDRPAETALWTIARAVEEVEAVRAAFGPEPVHLLGQSWGAFVGLEYALTHPRGLKSLILEGGAASIPHLQREWERQRLALGSETVAMMARHEAEGSLGHPEYQAALTIMMYRHICRLQVWPPALMRSISPENYNPAMFETVQGAHELGAWTGNLKDWDRLDRLHAIRTPTQVLSGFFDACSPATAGLLHAGLPDSRITIFNASSHVPFLEEPEAYFTTLSAFLDEQAGRATLS